MVLDNLVIHRMTPKTQKNFKFIKFIYRIVESFLSGNKHLKDNKLKICILTIKPPCTLQFALPVPDVLHGRLATEESASDGRSSPVELAPLMSIFPDPFSKVRVDHRGLPAELSAVLLEPLDVVKEEFVPDGQPSPVELALLVSIFPDPFSEVRVDHRGLPAVLSAVFFESSYLVKEESAPDARSLLDKLAPLVSIFPNPFLAGSVDR